MSRIKLNRKSKEPKANKKTVIKNGIYLLSVIELVQLQHYSLKKKH